VLAFALMIVVLSFRPEGFFGKPSGERA
jgi:branched-subunit amino acid ABC-type transport system permease component